MKQIKILIGKTLERMLRWRYLEIIDELPPIEENVMEKFKGMRLFSDVKPSDDQEDSHSDS